MSQFIKCVGSLLALAFVNVFFGCASSQPSAPHSKNVATENAQPMVCPIDGTPVTDESIYKGYFNSTPVYFASASNATQYGTLPLKQRAKLAAPQVLAQKEITNSTCPLTGETLTANADAVKYDGEMYGFASAADANQFRALPKKQQAKVMAAWKSGQTTSQSAAVIKNPTK